MQLVLEGELVGNWDLWFWSQPLQSSDSFAWVSEDVLRFGIVGFARGGIKTCVEDGILEKKQNPNLVVKLGLLVFGFGRWEFCDLACCVRTLCAENATATSAPTDQSC